MAYSLSSSCVGSEIRPYETQQEFSKTGCNGLSIYRQGYADDVL